MRSLVRRVKHRSPFETIPAFGNQLTNNSIDNNNGGFLRHYSQLAAVGKFENPQPDEQYYPPGQPFLHRVFGYRGVTLFPWLARVNDVDLKKQYPCNKSAESKSHISHLTSSTSLSSSRGSNFQNETDKEDIIDSESINLHGGKFHPYYQVLIDSRDCPFVCNRTQTEAVTFLGSPEKSKSIYSAKGLDYVAHEDILPYTSLEDPPIEHELQRKLFRFEVNASNPTGSNYVPTDLLESWKSRHPWLELSRVYRETTENVRVTVIPFYLGQTMVDSVHWWRYSVRLENFGDISVQLRERHWKIFSQTSMMQVIKGRGVVGVEPLLTKSEPAYQYSSHVSLHDKSGHMWGTFKMQREDGYTFECRIPPFSLISSLDTQPPGRSRQ